MFIALCKLLNTGNHMIDTEYNSWVAEAEMLSIDCKLIKLDSLLLKGSPFCETNEYNYYQGLLDSRTIYEELSHAAECAKEPTANHANALEILKRVLKSKERSDALFWVELLSLGSYSLCELDELHAVLLAFLNLESSEDGSGNEAMDDDSIKINQQINYVSGFRDGVLANHHLLGIQK